MCNYIIIYLYMRLTCMYNIYIYKYTTLVFCQGGMVPLRK